MVYYSTLLPSIPLLRSIAVSRSGPLVQGLAAAVRAVSWTLVLFCAQLIFKLAGFPRIPNSSLSIGSAEVNLNQKGQSCQAWSLQNFASGLWWYFACGLSYSPASTTRDLQRMRTMWGFCSHAILCLESLASLSTTSGAIVRILQCLPTALFWQLLRAAIFVVRLLQRNLLEFTPGRCWKSSPLRAVSCFYRFHFCWFGENCHCFGLT